jgi:uncharacterized membrane protein
MKTIDVMMILPIYLLVFSTLGLIFNYIQQILDKPMIKWWRFNIRDKFITTKNYIFANFLACMIWFVIGVVLFFSIAGFVLMIEDLFNKA